ncbi:MAG: RNA polymerase subunit sigma-24 [Thermobacillus sp.]|uniref:sigma-70 family RNA polymerase sigma factor n=1 Tax=Thermobacillus sp. TaxID=2108467 RepID=UPI000E3A8C0C|nr:sigma-70 family RNA polymerase sigma factor [Thermobacillus sp.]REK55297.1 MAG: RNA polymerase subunit sigma-24 [Thermobacillus sp.]
MTDEERIIKAQKGDYESFEAVVLKLKDKAYHIAYSYLRDEADSMDAVCDAVEKALTNLKQLKEPKYFSTWFIRIVINECKTQMRKRRSIIRLADALYDQGARTTANDEAMDLEQTLAALPPLERLLVKMKYVFGYSFEEIAEVTELPTNTVKSKVYATLRQMRIKMEVR